MLTLYRTPDCPRCAGIQDTLEDLAIAHEVIEVDSVDEVPEHLEQDSLPVLRDGDEVFQGSKAVADHLEEMKDFKEQWYKFQSDACYCDEEGNII